MKKQKHILMVIQDPHFIIGSVLQRRPYLFDVNLGLVKRVEKEYTFREISRLPKNYKYISERLEHEKPTGKYAFFNENIKEYLNKDEIIDSLSVKVVSD